MKNKPKLKSRVQAVEGSKCLSTRQRFAPEVRERMILEGAITFFAEHGFEGQIRDLANELGVSQALIFSYFGSKGALLERVYDEVYLSRWRDAWLDDLRDRTRPLKERLETYYNSYLEAIDEPIWIRIVLQSGLANNELTRRYVSRRIDKIVQALVIEVRNSLDVSLADMTDTDLLERVWDLQGSFIYGLIRKHVWRRPMMKERQRLVAGRVSQFLRGLVGPDPAGSTQVDTFRSDDPETRPLSG